MERCSTSLTIREMQTETIMRYYFTPVRIAIIKKLTNNKCWRGCEEKQTLLHWWWKCKLMQPIWKIVWRFLKKPTILSNNPTTGHTSEKTILKYTCIPIFTAAIFTIARTWLQPRCSSTDKWIKKCGIYV